MWKKKPTRRQFVASSASAALGSVAAPSFAPLFAQDTGLGFVPFVVLVHCDGGWDPTMLLDSKIGSTFVSEESGASARETESGLTHISHSNRPAVDTWFDTYGANAAIIKGLNAGSLDYENALNFAYARVPVNQVRPVDWLTFYTISLNPVLSIPHAVFDGPFFPGHYSTTAVKLNSELITQYLGSIPDVDSLGDAGETALSEFQTARFTGLANRALPGSLDYEKLFTMQALPLRDNAIRARLTTHTATLGAQGTDSDFLYHGKLAVELFANGHSQTATLQAGSAGAWDTTAGDHFATQATLYQNLFSDLTAIMAHASANDVLERMLIIVTSERGREPRTNSNGGKGPSVTNAALVWGAGIQGGITVGSTDAANRAVPIDPVFGSAEAASAVPIDMTHLMSAIYLKTAAPYSLIIPNVPPLSPILSTEEAE